MRNRLAAALGTALRRQRPPAAAPAIPDGYEARIETERQIYADQEVVHDLPQIFHYWSHHHLLPMMRSVGISSVDDLFADALARAYHERGDTGTARFVSVGAGNCDAEVKVAQGLLARGCGDFVVECLEINPAMLERGEALAAEQGVADHVRGVEADFNTWEPDGRYDGVIANQALHHVLNLEGLYAAIHGALAPTGRFVTSDMIGRNGHQRWPEARRIVDELWPELPIEYRYHHLLRRTEEEFMDWDCSGEGFEGIRAQDVLPLLVERFEFETFLGFGNVIDVFVDRGFGPNFDADGEWDRAFIDRVQARDMDGLRSGELKPTHVMAVMRSRPVAGGPRVFEQLTPEFCIRRH
jgi:SAM-dependent methyltransferase